MNYRQHYDILILRARDRNINGYAEKHHILPKCLGGTNSKENIVKLTAREHFVAHLLLVKIYPDNIKIKFALRAMTKLQSKSHMNNRLFSKLREEKNLHVGLKRSDETKRKISESLKGRKHSEEAKKNMSEAHKGQVCWAKGKTFTEEHKKRLSEAHKGKTYKKRA